MIDGPKKLDRRMYVYTGNNKLLYAKGSHLDTLDVVERTREPVGSMRVRAICKDRGRYMEEDGVDDDHDQDSP